MKPFVFLDRDGTLIVERNYLADPEQVELLPGVADALRRLRAAGYGIAVLTNQSGVGRGYFDLNRVEAIHARLRELLEKEGASLDAIYICPHTPEDDCACRKPRPGLVEQADFHHKIDRNRSFIIGDKACDIDCGRNVGMTSILVRTGYGASLERELSSRAGYVADDLSSAADWILRSR